MKLLFVHDATFKTDGDNRFYGTSVNNFTLERYKHISDDISVMIRTEKFMAEDSRSKYTEIADDYKIIPIPNLMSLRGMTIEYRKVVAFLEQELANYDCVISRLSGLVGEISAGICIKNNIPCIVECVGNPWDSLWYYGIKGKLVAPYFYYKTRTVINKAKYVIYVTDKYLQKIYPTKGKSIGCSNVTLPDEDDKVILKRREKISESRNYYVIGSAGKVDMKYKGYQYVIKAINKMMKKGIQVKYELVGGGDEAFLRSVAKKEGVEDFVSFKGVKPHEEVLKWMDTLDLYIQPSNTEGLPRALIEAMSRGCPCVGSDAGGIPELLPSTCIFKKKNIDELLKTIQYVINNMRKCSDVCYEKSKEYKIQTIVNKRNKFFDLFIKENNLGCMQNENND